MNAKRNRTYFSTWQAFLAVHRVLVGQVEHDLAATDELPLPSYHALLALAEAPRHRLRMHELARKLAMSRSGLTRLIDRLEGAHLLSREVTSTDRRGTTVRLTEQGWEALTSCAPAYDRAIHEHFGRYLTEEEARLLVDVFNRLLDAEKED